MTRATPWKLATVLVTFGVLTACNGLGPATTPIDTDDDSDTADPDTTDRGTDDPDTVDPDTDDPDTDDPDTEPDTSIASCTDLTVGSELEAVPDLGLVAAVTSPSLDGPEEDLVVVQFFSTDNGSFPLGTGVNANYATCEQCVFVATESRIYYADSGTLAVSGDIAAGSVDLVLADVGLVEVTIDQVDFTSTPVVGGDCLDLPSPLSLSSVVECIPDCSGAVCGDDGCGGSCGTCAPGSACSSEGQCETQTCDAVTPNDDLFAYEPYLYGATVAPNALDVDFLQVEFYTTDTGIIDLGSAINDNYETCEQCVRAFNTATDQQYYQTGGTLVVNDDPMDGSLDAVLTNGALVEVTIDDTTFTSTPVVGGECLALPSSLPLVADAITPACEPLSPPTSLVANGTNHYQGEMDGSDALGITLLQLEFYDSGPGTYDLASGANSDYATCTECVRAFTATTTQYYQSGGTLTLADDPEDGTLTATLTNGTLVEVDVDEVTLSSTPVAGGECIELPSPISFTGQ